MSGSLRISESTRSEKEMSVLRKQKCTKHTALWDHCLESEKENKPEKETEKEAPPCTTPGDTICIFVSVNDISWNHAISGPSEKV